MSNYKQCSKGHYYKGDVCPYCPTQLYPNTAKRKTDTLHKSVAPPDFETEVANIPLCPHCGRTVRKCVPSPKKGVRVSSIKCLGDGIVPWNYMWDGRCEHCGHDFNVVMRIDMGSTSIDNKIRETTVKVSSRGFLHHITCNWKDWRSTELSGVEIETKCGGNKHEKFFLSANELKYLMKVLQNSPILKQLDYYEECDEENSSSDI